MLKSIPSQEVAARSSQLVPIKFDQPYRWVERIRFGPTGCALKAIHVAEPGGFELLADAGTGFCLSSTEVTEFAYLFVARHVLTLTFVNDSDKPVATPQIVIATSLDDDTAP